MLADESSPAWALMPSPTSAARSAHTYASVQSASQSYGSGMKSIPARPSSRM